MTEIGSCLPNLINNQSQMCTYVEEGINCRTMPGISQKDTKISTKEKWKASVQVHFFIWLYVTQVYVCANSSALQCIDLINWITKGKLDSKLSFPLVDRQACGRLAGQFETYRKILDLDSLSCNKFCDNQISINLA